MDSDAISVGQKLLTLECSKGKADQNSNGKVSLVEKKVLLARGGFWVARDNQGRTEFVTIVVVIRELDGQVVLWGQYGEMMGEVGEIEGLFVEDSVVQVVLLLYEGLLHGEADVDRHAVFLLDACFEAEGAYEGDVVRSGVLERVVEEVWLWVWEGYRDIGGVEVGDSVVEGERVGLRYKLDDAVKLVEDLLDEEAV